MKLFVIKCVKQIMQNANKTLLQRVDIDRLAGKITNPNVKDKLAKFIHESDVRLWDFQVKASDWITKGDAVCFLWSDRLLYAEVVDKIADPAGEIQRAVGWHPFRNAVFRNPTVLKNAVWVNGLIPLFEQAIKSNVLVRHHHPKSIYELRSQL